MKLIIFALVLLFCSGCGSLINVSVDSISSGKLLNGSQCIIVAAEPITNQLQFNEYQIYVKKALEKKNYKITDNINEAQIVIFLTYGISDPDKSISSYNTPVYGQTGIASSNSSGTIRNMGNGMSHYSGTTTYNPEYGITGYETHIETTITYTRFIILDAYNLDENKKANLQLWRSNILSTGTSSDLRQIFPVMIAASAKYIGENTGKQIDLNLFENDKLVKEIKGLPTN